MTVKLQNPVEDTLSRLLKKVASAKSASKGEANIPPTSHPTGSLDGGNTNPPSGPTATEQKPVVAEAAQSNPVDGSKLPDGKGEKEHGLNRMLSDEKSNITPKMDSDDPMKKLSKLSTKELIAKSAALITPAAAQLLVDAAASAVAAEAGAPAPIADTSTVKVAGEQKVVTPTPEQVAKAAKEGADRAEEDAVSFLRNTIKEANEAADLLNAFTKLSVAAQDKLVKEAAKKKAEAAMPPMPPAAGGGAGPLPPEAGGGGMPPGGMPPGPGGAGGDDAALAAAAAGGEGGEEGGEGGAPGEGKMTNEQIEQLLMALLESQGNADPKALEASADPAAQMMGKQAREFLKQGKFEIRAPKNAKAREAINQMKQFIRETL